MKIHLKNFGPIHDFEFDLEKDFHVIYGENNIGKSYAMSAIYLILKNLPFFEQSNHIDFILKDRIFEKICLDIDEKIINGTLKELIIKSEYLELVRKTIQKLLISNIEKSFINSLSGSSINLKNKMSQEELSIIIKTNSGVKIFIISINNHLIIDKITGLEYVAKITKAEECVLLLHRENGQEYSYVNPKHFKTVLKDEFYEVYLDLFSNITKKFQIYFLPASRSGLYESLSSLSSIFAQLSQFRYQVNQQIEIPSLPEPIGDYFLNISTIRLDVNNQENIYQKFAEEIEKNLLGAEIIFNKETKKLEYFNPKIQLKLNLSETSSMVSEIAPIVAHLKYILRDTPNFHDDTKEFSYKVLFIEEPEAHLHPKIQVLLTEIFLELTKYKVKIVMTTHSNYIFNKINNLLLQKSIETNEIAVYHMIDTKKGSIVSEDSKPSEYGISDHNFAETSEQLYQERLDISDEWN